MRHDFPDYNIDHKKVKGKRPPNAQKPLCKHRLPGKGAQCNSPKGSQWYIDIGLGGRGDGQNAFKRIRKIIVRETAKLNKEISTWNS